MSSVNPAGIGNDFEQAKNSFLLGLACLEHQNFQDAERHFSLSLQYLPDRLSTLTNLAAVLIKLGQLERAEEIIDRTLKLFPDDPVIHFNQGQLFEEKSNKINALTSYKRAIELNPLYKESHYRCALLLHDLNRQEEAIQSYDAAIAVQFDLAEVYNNRGVALKDMGRSEEALQSYDEAIKRKENYADAHTNRGIILNAIHRDEEALKSLLRAAELTPEDPVVQNNLGISFKKLKRYPEAINCYQRALELSPDFAAAYYNLGLALHQMHEYSQALINYDKATAIKPDFYEAYDSQGLAYSEIKNITAAVLCHRKAIDINPKFSAAHNNLGVSFKELGQFNESLSSYDKALELDIKNADAHNNRGNILYKLKRFDEALESYTKALHINDQIEYLIGQILHVKMFIADWSNFYENLELLINKIKSGQKCAPSFATLALTDSLLIHRKAAEIWMNDKYPEKEFSAKLGPHKTKKRIRVAYYSVDLVEHPVAYLTAELFEMHDKRQFEFIAFYYGPPNSSSIHKRISASFDQFLDVRLQSDNDIARLSRDLEVDIAVDLTGITDGGRPGIFSYRAAPIQLSYIGYLGTMGANYYDYLIADKFIIPENSREHYSEKIAYLPSYQVNDTQREISDKIFSRAELNLPETGFVFCCFNNNYKITPSVFDGWMRILQAVPGSVLLMYAGNPWAEIHLKKEAEKTKVGQHRLIFAGRIPRDAYLARFKTADLFLDTLPYNAGTTASDALWAGLPVLTCMGESFASRVAASVLQAIGLPELITTSQAQYEARAIELATDATQLGAIQKKLAENRLTTALFDTPGFARTLEAAYRQMYERNQAGLPPDHLEIQPGWPEGLLGAQGPLK